MKIQLNHIVMFSGGAASWATAKRVSERAGTEDLILCFADTLMEDEDLYRFLDESAKKLGGRLVRLVEGRDPWQVFYDGRFLGNSRADPCSRILKRELIRKWLDDNFDPKDTVIYLGFDWNEGHRFERSQPYWSPWTVEAPLLDPPYLTKQSMLGLLRIDGIRPPRLYDLGFPHNNCGGFCIKAGKAQFRHLLDRLPERYAYHEAKENELREYLGKDISILRDRTGGVTKPLTLTKFREMVQRPGRQLTLDERFEWGGCGCMTPSKEEVTVCLE